MAEYENEAPAGYTVAAQQGSGPSALRVHSQTKKKSKPLEVIHAQTDAQLNKWGVVNPEDDPKNVAFGAYGVIADNKEALAQEIADTSPNTQSLINLNSSRWGEIDEEDTAEWQQEQNAKHSNSETWKDGAPKGYNAISYDSFVGIPIDVAMQKINA